MATLLEILATPNWPARRPPSSRESVLRQTAILDELRATEYGRLDARGDVYLDYTGGSLYASRRSRSTCRCCATASTATRTRQPDLVGDGARRAGAGGGAALLQRARERVRVHLHAERHGRAAARRRGLSVRPGGRFLATFDNHNSVNGIREFARAKGRDGVRAGRGADLRVAGLADHLDEADGHSLFAYPAQSNFSGVKHPLEWIDLARERGWDVLLDCAAFAPPAGSTSPSGRPTSSRCRSTRCSATRPAWAR